MDKSKTYFELKKKYENLLNHCENLESENFILMKLSEKFSKMTI